MVYLIEKDVFQTCQRLKKKLRVAFGVKRWDILEWTRSSVNVEERKTTRSWEGSLKGGGI